MSFFSKVNLYAANDDFLNQCNQFLNEEFGIELYGCSFYNETSLRYSYYNCPNEYKNYFENLNYFTLGYSIIKVDPACKVYFFQPDSENSQALDNSNFPKLVYVAIKNEITKVYFFINIDKSKRHPDFSESDYYFKIMADKIIADSLSELSTSTDNRLIKVNEHKIKALLKAPVDSIIITDRNGVIMLISESIKENYSDLAQEFIGKSIYLFISEPLKQKIIELIETNSFNEPIRFQNRIQEKWIDNFIYFIPDPETGNDMLAFYEVDITAIKHNEDKLERIIEEMTYNKDLIEDNAYQIIELNHKLEESELQLKELNANKDKFFSIISHDLKSPLTALLGFSELISTEYDVLTPEEIKDFSDNLFQSAKGLNALLENLLNWARAQTGRIPFEPRDFFLLDIVYDLLNIYTMPAKNKQLLLTTDVEKDLVVHGDTNMINTVIRNLISNSIKFTPHGGSITVSSKVNGDKCTISVADNGQGMDQASMDKLFRIDVHHTTRGTDNEKGTGLGLILCRDFVEKNGGTIWVESTIGQGTTFSFTMQLGKPIVLSV